VFRFSVAGHFVAEIHLVPSKQFMVPFSSVGISLGLGIAAGIVLRIGQGTLKAIGLELPQKRFVLGHVEILFEDGNDVLAVVNLKCHSVVDPGNDVVVTTFLRVVEDPP